ncbi:MULTISPECIES: Fe-S protein assembly co-chaperone HscB [Achromobacter]|uniref:Co-chaperone protein HscB homolog n=1 Tax=Achromobacter denitrificans TaxID=32002 RepID=A0A427WN85_ACHDE|nr:MULTISPECIES: Fe-S protein assembly co-chaperone HscB [Achromobacter]ASC67070.1 Fe-S protein assembly co-chaperone HscB [Achromobacter denitrificans]MDF3848727.1 Fe-S protein assembly co-chaperone HscB [Achromobacter denitrificans]MDF3862673.1 Fe-S protein assembly co-chaperone HscB [Achromobacter denitrificans]OLU09408.1 Fe-S protein assembly co-chaperone HscB [Achromobacter denitrificans]QCS65324.1 Fe-S protein assembly co-chaperone HscB [Achromobacter denitrificans]
MAGDDHFSLFGLPARFDLDAQALESAWRAVAAQVHPDRYATASPAERRVAMQWAARANEAYRQLRDPLLRARYLCEQAGVDLQTESNTSMDGAFLMQQMTWREMLDDARGDAAALAALQAELQQARDAMRATLARLLDQDRDYAAAGLKVREWMFVEKLAEELANAQPAG